MKIIMICLSIIILTLIALASWEGFIIVSMVKVNNSNLSQIYRLEQENQRLTIQCIGSKDGRKY